MDHQESRLQAFEGRRHEKIPIGEQGRLASLMKALRPEKGKMWKCFEKDQASELFCEQNEFDWA